MSTPRFDPFGAPPAGPPPDRVAMKQQARRDKAAVKELLAPINEPMALAGFVVAVAAVGAVVPLILIAQVCALLLSDPVDTGLVAQLVLIAFLVLLARGALQIIGLVWAHRLDSAFQITLRQALAAKLARVPLGWFTERSSAHVKRLLADDVHSLHYLVAHARLENVNAAVIPLVSTAYLLVVDWRLALVMLIPLIAYMFALSAMTAPAHNARLGRFNRGEQAVEAAAVEFVDGIAVVRAFGQTRKAHKAYQDAVDEYADALAAWKTPITKIQAAADILLTPVFLSLFVAAAAVGMGALGWIGGADAVPFFIVGVGIGASLLGLAYGSETIREGSAAGARLLELQQMPELSVEKARKEPEGDRRRGAVCFDSVGFGYRKGSEVLSGISFDLEPGTITALVGPSGSGKSTLARLLARFYDPTSGSITLGGRDIRTIAPDELYSQIGLVLQDAQLIRGTVADNLRLARPSATDAELEQAARAAQIHERIMALPAGYDSVIGIDVVFSGGEAQRLSIARTLLADSRVLVLDEATAFADPDSEAAVQDALAALVADRTVLVIAHRLHTITRADQILVLDGGRLVEEGDHEGLLEADGLYARLWRVNEDATAILDEREGASAALRELVSE